MGQGNLSNYKNMVSEMIESVGHAIGIHVMLLVIEHALWSTKLKYEEAELISFSEAGVAMDGLDNLEPKKAGLIAHSFMMSMIATLGRLVGTQLARQLTEQLQADVKEE